MKKFIFIILFLTFIFEPSFAKSYKKGGKKYSYKKYYHVKSMVIFDEKHPLFNPFGGIHHVYANKKALNEIKKSDNRTFEDGSMLFLIVFEHKLDNGAYLEGDRKITAYMIKDSNKYKETDGWGYFAWDAKGKNLIKDMKNDCHSCHSQVKNKDFVFSDWKE